jgi:hypothetical protein
MHPHHSDHFSSNVRYLGQSTAFNAHTPAARELPYIPI